MTADLEWSAILTLVLTLQGVSLIVLALFAPFAIGTLVSYFTGTKPEIKALEQRVLLTQVLRRTVFTYALLALVFLPFFSILMLEALSIRVSSFIVWLLNNPSFAIRGFDVIVWGIRVFGAISLAGWLTAVAYFLVALNMFYDWLSNKDKIIVGYFRNPLQIPSKRRRFRRDNRGINLNEKVNSWSKLWGMDLREEKYLDIYEVLLFGYFANDIDDLINTSDKEELRELLRLVSMITTEKRSPLVTVNGDFSRKVLEWHHSIWEKWVMGIDIIYRSIAPDLNLIINSIYSTLTQLIRELIKEHFANKNETIIAILNAQKSSSSHFDSLQSHITRYGKEFSKVIGLAYGDRFNVIFDDILTAVRESEGPECKIPDVLQVNISNYEKEPMCKVSSDRVLIHLKAMVKNSPHDKNIGKVLSTYFREVDIEVFGRALILLFSSLDAMILTNFPVNFNSFGEIHPESVEGVESVEQQQKIKFDKAIELAKYFFGKDIAENLPDWGDALNEIPFGADSAAGREKQLYSKIYAALKAEAASADEQSDSSAQQTD